jgi:FkbM family methyltransferase
MTPFFDYLKLTLYKFFNYSAGNKIKLAGYTVYFGNISQLKLLYKEIFIKENYKCELSDTPCIIDGGANIGLAVLYFKKHFPGAKIIAFEPNAESFECLKKNVELNKLNGVEIYQAALSDKEGTLTFYTSSDMPSADVGASAVKGHVDHYHSDKGKIIEVTVPCKNLSPFMHSRVDLLKLDIEGSEGMVIKEIADHFSKVDNLIMEYHYQADNTDNKLSDILKVIENSGHQYFVSLIGKSVRIKKVNSYLIQSKALK